MLFLAMLRVRKHGFFLLQHAHSMALKSRFGASKGHSDILFAFGAKEAFEVLFFATFGFRKHCFFVKRNAHNIALNSV